MATYLNKDHIGALEKARDIVKEHYDEVVATNKIILAESASDLEQMHKVIEDSFDNGERVLESDGYKELCKKASGIIAIDDKDLSKEIQGFFQVLTDIMTMGSELAYYLNQSKVSKSNLNLKNEILNGFAELIGFISSTFVKIFGLFFDIDSDDTTRTIETLCQDTIKKDYPKFNALDKKVRDIKTADGEEFLFDDGYKGLTIALRSIIRGLSQQQ